MARLAQPKIEPRKRGWVVMFRGRRVFGPERDRRHCETYLEGWREGAEARAKVEGP